MCALAFGSKTAVALAVLGLASNAAAQAPGTPVCVPGTTVCASADGKGGVRIDANGQARASPQGVNASGQANASGNGNANANANGNANANATGDGSGDVEPRGSGTGSYRSGYTGRFGTGLTLCPLARLGVWSGFKAGGCIAFGFRWEAFSFEMETQLLYGGPTHAFDWTFPMSFLIPLDNEDSLFDGPYLRFGASPVGVTFARKRDGGSFIRFGLFAGGGYELEISDALAWRVVDARLAFDMGTKRAMDDQNHWVDLGFQIGTGIVF